MQKNIPEPISDNSGDPAVVRQRQQADTIRQPLGDGAFLFWEGFGEGLFTLPADLWPFVAVA
jgi:hypothetical protein